MNDELSIHVSGTRINVSGELTQANAQQLTAALRIDTTEVDLAEVTFVDSAGLAALIGAKNLQPGIRIIHPSDNITRAIELSGLAWIITPPKPS